MGVAVVAAAVIVACVLLARHGAAQGTEVHALHQPAPVADTESQLQSTVGLHFFEPRYRILVQRALQEPRRQRSFVFLPNFEDYQASHGDIGYLATIIAHRYCPTGDPNELPSADIKIHFGCRVLIHFHWVESDTGGLAECVCVPLEPRFADPMNDIAPLSSSAQISAWPANPNPNPNPTPNPNPNPV